MPVAKFIDFSPGGEMVALNFCLRGISASMHIIALQLFFTRYFTKERNTDRIPGRVKYLVKTKGKRGLVILVRNAGQDELVEFNI